MGIPTKFVATFSVNSGNEEIMERPNKAKMADELRKIIRKRAGENGNGQYEIRKMFTDEERSKMHIPDDIKGQIIELGTFTNGKNWSYKRPFKKYF
ncbi:hypothetical protein C7120_09025 [Prevotella sp. oral taxon 376]|uniref:hypothetical protein n=1 Tax=Prevotella sp. oral taxon 376 TaxID=712466 RepID=UPI000D1FC475|nr:hypothetical protein [Prevotella sp. oral taxon 376]PTL34632.1 hypothetical protein C7120_09025 [Prevotella sp. oral taxon 376]